MWSVGSKVVDVYLGTRAVAVCRGEQQLLAQAADGVDTAIEALQAWLAHAPTRQKLCVWLSGGVCRPFLVPAVPGLKSRAELERVAQSMATAATGLHGECQVWLEPGSLGEARVAVALPKATLERLLGAIEPAEGRAHRLLSLRPWWGELLRATLRQTPSARVVAAQDCDALTMIVGRDGGFEFVSCLSPVTDRATAEAALARQLLLVDIGDETARLAQLSALGSPEADQAEPRLPGLALAPWTRVAP